MQTRRTVSGALFYRGVRRAFSFLPAFVVLTGISGIVWFAAEELVFFRYVLAALPLAVFTYMLIDSFRVQKVDEVDPA